MARQVIKLEKVKRISLRQQIAEGILPELEYCLLCGGSGSGRPGEATKVKKTKGDDIASLRIAARAEEKARKEAGVSLSAEDKEVLLNMEIDTLRARRGDDQFEVEVRSLCHSRGVTADYLDRYERFNMKQVVLILGNLGKSRAPWAELVQPATYLHRHEFNILWLDIPAFASNQAKWMKYGPTVLRAFLRSFSLKNTAVLACGLGGAVFLETLAHSPGLFGTTHIVYNMDLPAFKEFNLSIGDIEDILRVRELQFWFTYVDSEDYDRGKDGSPQRAYDGVAKLQARLQGERERGRGRRNRTYDELLITENLNMNPAITHCETREMSVYQLLRFSEDCLYSMAHFLESVPTGRQADLEGGLVGNYRAAALSQALKGGKDLPDGDVLPSMRRRRLAPELGLADRETVAHNNRVRLNFLENAVKYLELPAKDHVPALRDLYMSGTNMPRGPGGPLRKAAQALTMGSVGSKELAGFGMSTSSSSPALVPAHLRPLADMRRGNTGDLSGFGSTMSPIGRMSAEDMLAQIGDDDLLGTYKPQTPLQTTVGILRTGPRSTSAGTQGTGNSSAFASSGDDGDEEGLFDKTAGDDTMEGYRQQRIRFMDQLNDSSSESSQSEVNSGESEDAQSETVEQNRH